jgi:hypothetical protein
MQPSRFLLIGLAGLGGFAAGDTTRPIASAEQSCEWSVARPTFDLAWHALTDQQLYVETRRTCGHVLIGFKEAGAARGVDEKGAALTSAATVASMKAFLHELKVVVDYEYDLPAIAARIQPSLELIRLLRHHPNVDYLEPNFPGTRW